MRIRFEESEYICMVMFLKDGRQEAMGDEGWN